MSKIIGITGPTGAGKTTISNVFLSYGCYVIDSDKIAKKILENNIDCLNKLVLYFGNQILDSKGFLDRRILSQIVFSDTTKLKRLNEIIHPLIVAKIKNTIEMYESQFKIIVIDAALLFESKLDEICDIIITILSSKKIRLSRIINRDNLSDNEAKKRIEAQNDDEFYKKNSNFVLDGNLNLENINIITKDFINKIGG